MQCKELWCAVVTFYHRLKPVPLGAEVGAEIDAPPPDRMRFA